MKKFLLYTSIVCLFIQNNVSFLFALDSETVHETKVVEEVMEINEEVMEINEEVVEINEEVVEINEEVVEISEEVVEINTEIPNTEENKNYKTLLTTILNSPINLTSLASMPNIVASESWNFPYVGTVQTFIAPYDGEYFFEVWGAQGGGNGGKGGFSYGKITLTKGTEVYVNVGGQGTNTMLGGGFNGGGNPTNTSYYGGGGASDIRINVNSLYARAIVAGGGGGFRGSSYAPGAGGGINGFNGSIGNSDNAPGYGGTQTSGGQSQVGGSWSSYVTNGSFGFGGGHNPSASSLNGFAGGGGGRFGGGCGHGAGGGSSRVFTQDTYNAGYTSSQYIGGNFLLGSEYFLAEADTIDGKSTIPNPTGGTLIGNAGNGFARISFLGIAGDISYSPSDFTNQDVVATLSLNITGSILSSGWTTVIDGKVFTKVFTTNTTGEVVVFQDENNLTNSATINITWIDKNPVVGTINYDIMHLTNQDVRATISFNKEDVTITNNINDEYVFTQNGEFIFNYQDKYGNTGTALAKVDRIDKEDIEASIIYSNRELTNQNVEATIIFNKSGVVIQNNNGENRYTFTENDYFEFYFYDIAGNTGSALARVDWIDKEVPTCEIEYDSTVETRGSVVVKLKNCSEEIIILNNLGKDEYLFTTNGDFIFNFRDKAGNIGQNKASVTWILPSNGGGIKLKPDNCPNGDYSKSLYDDDCGMKAEGEEGEHNTAEEKEIIKEYVSERFENNSVYERARKEGLTSMPTYKSSRREDNITRAEVAKIISLYAIKNIHMKVDEISQCNAFVDLDEVDSDLQTYIITACQLGLMGYYSDGISVKEQFLPNEKISKAEVATIVSRMLRGNEHKGSEEWWYQNHLLALQREAITTYDSPMTLESRGNVFTMLNKIEL